MTFGHASQCIGETPMPHQEPGTNYIMLDRYSYPQMKAIWELENRYNKWLEVELLVAEGLAEIGQVPKEAAQALRKNAKFKVQRVLEIEGEVPGYEPKPGEEVVKHDLIAFLKAVMENLGEEKHFLHLGVTSYDIEDTALSLMMRESLELIEKDTQALMEAIRARAKEYKWTPMIGRSHGIHAEPITVGHKFAVWLAEMERNLERLAQAKQSVAAAKISGAVGTYANIDPRVEEYVCKKLGLAPAKAATQVLQRDRHAHFVTTLAILAGSLEQFATELRHLQRTEVLEMEERFGAGQRGSSAMPHKRNPITSERVTGLARLVRSYVIPALENMALWHERDICHSSVERVILPDASILTDYMLRKFTDVVRNLTIYPEHMQANLDLMRGLVNSEQVMLTLVRKGMGKDDAYKLVQSRAMRVWSERVDFHELLKNDPEIRQHLSEEELAECFDIKHHMRNMDKIYERLDI
jgi:adenylosuccinate lyase